VLPAWGRMEAVVRSGYESDMSEEKVQGLGSEDEQQALAEMEQYVAEEQKRPRLLSVEIGEWPGLGGNVGFDLGERVTVLVGRNGSGKSLLMEGLWSAMRTSLGRQGAAPKAFASRASLASGRISYRYAFEERDQEDPVDMAGLERTEPRKMRRWQEQCRNDEDFSEIWRIAQGELYVQDRPVRPFYPGLGLIWAFGQVDAKKTEFPEATRTLHHLFVNSEFVPAGIPRLGSARREILVSGTSRDGARQWLRPYSFQRDEYLVWSITSMWDQFPTQYNEFVDLVRQMGIVNKVEVHTYEGRNSDPREGAGRVYASVHFDGINFGLCSDGTQRITDIARLLVRSEATCILIEEPEIAVHPSLLERLLHIFDSYAQDRQIVISTHSPDVVDWCKPENLRLVERKEGRTIVSRLSEEKLDRVHDYLRHDGTFSDLVYRHASDDED